MSGPALRSRTSDDLLLDAGVLQPVPTCEWHGWSSVEAHGGSAILVWRQQARAAAAAGVEHHCQAPLTRTFSQVVVRIGKGRAATEADLAAAWQVLVPGGRLLLVGSNDVGIATWAKRVAAAIGVAGEVLANRAHGRVVAFTRCRTHTSAVLPNPAPSIVPLPDGTPLQVAPGVFSADGLDGGTRLLLQAIAECDLPADFSGKIVDVGCGAGHLGVAAARRWPAAGVTLLDADARAVACARANVQGTPIRVAWWDEDDAWPVVGPVVGSVVGSVVGQEVDAELALLNPPCHAGTSLDLTAARRLFGVIQARRLLVVANRQLAYEADLQRLGEVVRIAEDSRFKVLSVTRF